MSAAHFTEVAFVFYNIAGVGYAVNPFENGPESYKVVAKAMSDAWVRFFVGMDPTGGASSGLQWPVYDHKTGGGVGKNIVWDAERVSYLEWDSWRAEGIDWMIQNSLSVFGS
jgi:carboxylesterase type B